MVGGKRKVDRFSSKMLFKIEDFHAKGNSIQQIARKLKITPTDVRNGLNRIFAEEMGKEAANERNKDNS